MLTTLQITLKKLHTETPFHILVMRNHLEKTNLVHMASLAGRNAKIYHQKVIASDGYFGFASFSWEFQETSTDETKISQLPETYLYSIVGFHFQCSKLTV